MPCDHPNHQEGGDGSGLGQEGWQKPDIRIAFKWRNGTIAFVLVEGRLRSYSYGPSRSTILLSFRMSSLFSLLPYCPWLEKHSFKKQNSLARPPSSMPSVDGRWRGVPCSTWAGRPVAKKRRQADGVENVRFGNEELQTPRWIIIITKMPYIGLAQKENTLKHNFQQKLFFFLHQ